MSPYRNAPPPESVRGLRPWRSKGPLMFGLLVIVCTAFVVAPRTPAVPGRARAAADQGSAVTGGDAPMVAVWSARVERSGVTGIEEGSRCEISADVGVREAPYLRQIRVACGGRVVYASTPNPDARRALAQRFGKEPGTLVFEAAYDDHTLVPPRLRFGNPTTVRPHADTEDIPARLQLGVGPDDRLDLRVTRTSAPWVHKPLGTYASAGFDRPARVLTASGKRMAAPGTMCRMQVMPTAEDLCDVTVDCRPGAAYWDPLPAGRLQRIRGILRSSTHAPGWDATGGQLPRPPLRVRGQALQPDRPGSRHLAAGADAGAETGLGSCT